MTTLGPEVHSRYDDISPLDRGGWTELYRAKHRVLAADHVLRVLRRPAHDASGAREVVLTRARAQARLRHPTWVRVHNVFEEAELVVVACDPAGGVALDELVAGGPLPPERAVAVVATLADALEELHQLGVVHHELRPSAVRIDRATLAPRLTHLSARYQHEGEGDAVPFASPEELVSPGSGDARADVHALGALLFLLLTGHPPFPAETRSAALLRRLSGELPPLDGDPALVALVRAAMSDRAADRPPGAADFARRLREWRPATATPVEAAVEPPPPPVEVSVVPDAPTPAPLPSPSPAPAPALTTKKAAKAGSTTSTLVGAGLVLAVVGAAAIGAGWWGWRGWCREKSVSLTTEAFGTLRHFKTDAAANDDAGVLDAAVRAANEAVDYDPSPRALGVDALALAWDEGWHLASAHWDEARFRAADARTRAAIAGGTPEAWLARGLVMSGGCKLVDASDSRRLGWCAEAEQAFDRALSGLGAPDVGWLRFEVLWSQAANFNQAALSARLLGDTAAEATGWARAMDVCDRGYALLADAPVNDRELEQECVAAAGGSGRYDDYFKWARALQADDRADDGKLKSTNVESIYRGARSACVNLHFERNRKKRTVPETGGKPEFQFCYAAGLLALGCLDDAATVMKANIARDPTLPWAEIAGKSGSEVCYLAE